MKCLLIFDHLNDIIYVKSNTSFDTYIVKLCKRDGLLSNEDDHAVLAGSMEFHNALVQLFSPMVASQRIMSSQFSSPYSGLQCDDGTCLVLSEYLGFVLAAVGKDYNANEFYLRKKLKTFQRLATFVCGPTLDILKVVNNETLDRCNLLGDMMDTWERLYHRDLPFLLEAQERLLTNLELNTVWVRMLQNVLEKVRSRTGSVTPCHAFVLVDTKVLALYSRNACLISEADILLLTVLAATHHADLAPRCECEDCCREENAEPALAAAADDVITSELQEDMAKIRIEGGVFDGKTSHRGVAKSVEVSEEFVYESADFRCSLVFMSTEFGSLTPYVVHTVHVSPSIALVIVCMANRHLLSGSLVRAIEMLHEIQSVNATSPTKISGDAVETAVRHVGEHLKKQKLLSAFTKVEEDARVLTFVWDRVKRNGLYEFLKRKDESKQMTTSLESNVTQLSSHLRRCFQEYCIAKYCKNLVHNGSLIDAQAVVRYTMADYVDYLKVKARRNISMSTYYTDYPGLIHFMFVDRINNQITAPVIDCSRVGDGGSDDSEPISTPEQRKHGDILWKKLYSMVEKAWQHLQMGHTSLIWRDDCFHYSYFIWFEDPSGNPRKPEVPFLPVDSLPMPGTLCGNFFRKFVQSCFPSSPEFVRCYELFCIHLAAVPVTVVNQHARRLTANVWEVSGAAQSPVDLLL